MDRAWEVIQKLREDGRERLTTSKSAEVHAKNTLAEAEEKKDSAEKRLLRHYKIRVPNRSKHTKKPKWMKYPGLN